MTDHLKVDYAAVLVGAREHLTLAARADAADARRQAATLPAGSLGKLPAADEVRAVFDAQYAAVGEALAALSGIYESVRDQLVATVEEYEGTDTAVSQMMERGLSTLDSAAPAPSERVLR